MTPNSAIAIFCHRGCSMPATNLCHASTLRSHFERCCVRMAAQPGSDEEQYRRRKLVVVDGRLSVSGAADLRLFIRSVPSGHYQSELTHLVLNAVSLQQITKEMCLLTNLTRLGTPPSSSSPRCSALMLSYPDRVL